LADVEVCVPVSAEVLELEAADWFSPAAVSLAFSTV